MKSFHTIACACLAAAPLLTAASPLDPAKFAAPIRVACVGDSITAGSHAGPEGAYPTQLQKLLGDHWLVGNFGVSGRTALRQGDFPYWNDQALTNAESFRPDVVIILLGTNDTKPQNWLHGDEFGKDYTDLVNIFLGLPSKPVVFVCRPTPVAEPGNYGINEAVVQEEIPIIDRIAADLNLGVIDMHAALEGKPQLLADRVHPNADGAKVLAETACRALTGKEPVSAGNPK
jgi:lysophospholipase L1-like esterase